MKTSSLPMNTKRGQGAAAGVAVLPAVIAGLLVMFVVLVQPSERAKILGDEGTSVTVNKPSGELDRAASIKNLLKEYPGRIDYLAQKEVEHPLPAINIYTTTEAALVAGKNLAYAKKSLFSEEQDIFSFTLQDVAHTEEAMLVFNVRELSGRLMITLNGEELFDAPLGVGNVAPIPLPKNALREQNQLTISLSSPGIAFWKTHEATLENLKIIADVTDVEAQTARQTFLVSETEKRNLNALKLQFQPTCKQSEIGSLTIRFNEEVLYDAVPDCDLAFVPIEIDPNTVLQGENTPSFRTATGAYLLSHAVVVSKLNDVDFPAYYFELSNENFEEIQQGKKRARLELHFVDVGATKYGDVQVNGHVHHFDTKEISEAIDVSADVVRGNNAIKVKPRKTVEIRELRVD